MDILGYPVWAWGGFATFILTMLALDLGLFNRKTHIIRYREATIWSAVWVTLALIFAAGVFWQAGSLKGKEFLTGYIIELSLSVDNLFVFLLIFSYFKVPAKYQHRVLFWGVLGALVMRITMIFLGTTLINRFNWIIYFFGAFLVFTGIKMFSQDEEEIRPEQNPIVRFITNHVPITRQYVEEKFFVGIGGRLTGTLLLLVLVVVEITDLIFAVDSIPAIFGVTTDTFIVYTSNVFAILGLRSLYFLLAGVVEKFHYLKIGLAVVLTFIGTKMLLTAVHIHIPIEISLGVVAVMLVGAVIASLIWPQKAETGIHVSLPPGFSSIADAKRHMEARAAQEAPKEAAPNPAINAKPRDPDGAPTTEAATPGATPNKDGRAAPVPPRPP
jgi:tellurite resistance protein TerC